MQRKYLGLHKKRLNIKRCYKNDKYELHLADCAELASEVETGSIDIQSQISDLGDGMAMVL